MSALLCFQSDRPAEVVRPSVPRYPLVALQTEVAGVVHVRVTLDQTGRPTAAAIERSPAAVLNAPAVDAARRSTFRPGRRHCTPVASTYDFRVLFDLKGPVEPLPSEPRPPISAERVGGYVESCLLLGWCTDPNL